ncbi:MAG: hypothetical protein MHM6MM_001109 [Cercozoa sp. M6MM]
MPVSEDFASSDDHSELIRAALANEHREVFNDEVEAQVGQEVAEMQAMLRERFDRIRAHSGEPAALLFLLRLSDANTAFCDQRSEEINQLRDALSPPAFRFLMLGADAGKTSLLFRLKHGENPATIPTIGFNVEEISFHGITLNLWDIGGAKRLRPLWRHYMQGTHAILLLFGACSLQQLHQDKERVREMQEVLEQVRSMIEPIAPAARPCVALVISKCDTENDLMHTDSSGVDHLDQCVWDSWLADDSPVKHMFEDFRMQVGTATALFEVSAKHPEQPVRFFRQRQANRTERIADAIDNFVMSCLPQAQQRRFARDLSLCVARAAADNNVLFGTDSMLTWSVCQSAGIRSQTG